jgi:hypothetical protein
MLVNSKDRATDIINRPVHFTSGIDLLLNALKEALPDASSAPAIETAGYGAPEAIAFGRITPGAPVLRIYNMPLRVRRWSEVGRLVFGL